jgi:hypothetical protein
VWRSSWSTVMAWRGSRQCRDYGFRHGEAEQRRLWSDAVGIALCDDAASLHDDDRAGAAIGRLRRFGESAVERGRQRLALRRHNRRAGDLGEQRRLFVVRRQRDVGDIGAMVERTAEPLTIDGMAAAEAEQRHRDVLADAVDLKVHRPGEQTGARHRIGGLGEVPPDIETRDEGFRAEDVGDEAGGDLGYVAGPRRAEREACTGNGGGEEDDLAAAGHGLSPASGRVPDRKPERRDARSPDLKNDPAETNRR